MEIERKFLLTRLPDNLPPGAAIRQGYLAVDGTVEVRVREIGDEAVLTIKAGHGEERVEEEVPISPERFAALWPLTAGRRVSKTRHRLAFDPHVVEVDVYDAPLAGLLVAEVEFASSQASREFAPPPWLGAEVTGDRRYANASLAVAQRIPDPT